MEQQLCLKYLYKIFIAGILIVVALYGCGKKEKAVKEEKQDASDVVYVTDPDKVLEGPIISLPQQVINIQGGGLLFLKVAIQHAELGTFKSESVLVTRYLDGVIQVASMYTSEELSSDSGKEKLKEELFTKLNELSDSETQVSKIYFETILVR